MIREITLREWITDLAIILGITLCLGGLVYWVAYKNHLVALVCMSIYLLLAILYLVLNRTWNKNEK